MVGCVEKQKHPWKAIEIAYWVYMVSWGVGSNFAYKAWVFLEPYILNDVARIIVPMIVMKSSQILHKNIERDQHTRRKHLT